MNDTEKYPASEVEAKFAYAHPVSSPVEGETFSLSLEQLKQDAAWPEEGKFTLPVGWSGNGIVEFDAQNADYPYVVLLKQHAPGYDYQFPKAPTNGRMPVHIYPGSRDRELAITLPTYPARDRNPYLGSSPFVMMPKFFFQGNREEGTAYVYERIKVGDPGPNPYFNLLVATVTLSFSR